MPVLRSTALIDAPPRTVAGLLRDAELTATALARVGHRVRADVRLLAPGDEVLIDVRLLPWVRVPVRLVVDTVAETGLAASLVAGPPTELAPSVTLSPTPAGTLVLEELRWAPPRGLLLRVLGRIMDVAVLRRLVLRAQAARLQVLAERAAALSGATIVVATALHRGGAVLVAQRTRPPLLAGRWELPGGRVEPGEAEQAAVHRECREELGVAVTVTGRLGTDLPIDGGVLRVYVAELDPDTSEPQPLEHAALRWAGPDVLAELDWVAADRAVLADLVNLIRTPVVARPEG